MKLKSVVAAMTLSLTFQAHSYDRYSVFEDYVDQTAVANNNLRLTNFIKLKEGVQEVVGEYKYDQNKRIIQRKYLDSIFNYEYNSDGTLKLAKALMYHDNPNIIIRHTKENFISEYEYKDNEFGQKVVNIEIKKVFNREASSLDGEPETTYRIKYVYNEQGKLIKRIQTPSSGLGKTKLTYRYSYNDDGRLRKVKETNRLDQEILDQVVLLLQYYDNGEIKKATQKKGRQMVQSNQVAKEEQVLKVIELDYVDNESLIYGVHYVDPVKEWKVDMDFFGLAFHPINSMKVTRGDKVTQFQYFYEETDKDQLPDNLDVKLTLPNGYVIENKYKLENQK